MFDKILKSMKKSHSFVDIKNYLKKMNVVNQQD